VGGVKRKKPKKYHLELDTKWEPALPCPPPHRFVEEKERMRSVIDVAQRSKKAGLTSGLSHTSTKLKMTG
jgi:hypothetical protein